MQKELQNAGVDVAFFALNEAPYASQVANVASQADFPVLNDSAAVKAWAALGVPSKEYVLVWGKDGGLVSAFKPWESGLSNAGNYAKIKDLLVMLAK